MIIAYIFFVLGICLLIKSANWIVDGSSSLAKKLGVSSLIIGLTVVAFGTSLPELVVNLFATLKGSSGVVFGNIIGSNIANILLILGIVAMIGNVKIKSETVWKEIPFALLAVFVLFALTGKVFFSNGHLFSWNDGLVLLALFVMFLYYIFQIALKDKKNIGFIKDSNEPNLRIALKLTAGLVGIYFAGLWVVDGAVLIAEQFGLSEFLISATIIALGTSLPELVVSVMAVMKKNVDLAVGNIIGSNVFNILWVLGIVPFVAPLKIPEFIGFDIGIMFLATLLLFIFMFIGKKHGLSKKEGAMLILFYMLYIVYIIIRG